MKRFLHPMLLMITALIWGTAFVAQSLGGKAIGAFTLTAMRSFVGGIVLVPCIMLLKVLLKTGGNSGNGKLLLKGGMLCGVLLGLASMAQQYGIAHTTVGKAGFLTALYIILVPFAGLFLGKRPTLLMFASAFLALWGMYLLCFKEAGGAMSKGDVWLCVCAVLFTMHIMSIDYFAPKVDCLKLACLQFFAAGVVSLLFAVCTEKIVPSEVLSCWGPILYLGVMSSGIAYTLQVVGQSGTHPVVASLIMSLEAVFAALAGALYLGENMTCREIWGSIIIFAAIILAQVPPKYLFLNRLFTKK
ncbi:MAG: DMT family transporter [Victivallales bacterium]|nr:DMT family transporter [Victivallales bacterium]